MATISNKYIFSGHESFPCKSLWLKKGYDFIVHGNNFSSPDAVIQLGVGKNMGFFYSAIGLVFLVYVMETSQHG